MHMTVKDTPPPTRSVVVGSIYPIGQKRDEEEADVAFLADEDDAPEVKVVQRGRRPQPKARTVAETA